MKGSGMNKLIELLNEYDDGMVSWYEEYFPTEGLFVTNAGQGFREEFILGKRYGFIKWLLDNDKIDLGKVKNIKLPVDTNLRARVDKDEKTCFNRLYTLKLLMLLAISENPISDLISYLR